MRRGVTLIELLTVLVIAVFISAALANSMSASVRYQVQTEQSRETFLAQMTFEDRLKSILSRAYVDTDAANPTSYFVGRVDSSGMGAGEAGTGSNELIFTTVGDPLTGEVVAEQEQEFSARNELIGANGGVTEVRLALSPASEDAGDATGLFLREQVPADEDPEQGGYERLLDQRVTSLSFEFFDGLEWITEWDSNLLGRRVPSAVRVSYTLDVDETVKVMTVRMRNSDVTPNSPASATGEDTP